MNKFYHLLLRAGIIPVALALSIGCSKDEGQPPATGSAPPLKIGVSAPLTGDGANYGRSTREGVDLAIAEFNAAQPNGSQIQVIYEDDRINPRDGVNAVTKLITVDKVPIILGPFGSSVVLAAAPVANRSEVVILSASATADSIANAGDFVFRIAPPNSRQGADIADFLVHNQKARAAAVVYQNNDYGVTLRDAFKKRFQEAGGRIVAEEAVEEGATDLRAQVTKIRTAKPDAIFFPLHYAESGLFLRQAADLDVKSVFISADGAMTADMLKLAGVAAEGTYYTSLALGYGVADSAITRFEGAFRKKYGHDPDVYAAYYYDAARLAATALKEGNTTGPAVRDYLYALSGDRKFGGVSGFIEFDRLGEVTKGFTLYRVKGGDFVRNAPTN